MIVTQALKTLTKTLQDANCFGCKVLNSAYGRVYFENDELIIVENLSTMTPILVAKAHQTNKIPLQAFIALKKVCAKLFNDSYCFNPSPLGAEHYVIKVVKLNSVELPVY